MRSLTLWWKLEIWLANEIFKNFKFQNWEDVRSRVLFQAIGNFHKHTERDAFRHTDVWIIDRKNENRNVIHDTCAFEKQEIIWRKRHKIFECVWTRTLHVLVLTPNKITNRRTHVSIDALANRKTNNTENYSVTTRQIKPKFENLNLPWFCNDF